MSRHLVAVSLILVALGIAVTTFSVTGMITGPEEPALAQEGEYLVSEKDSYANFRFAARAGGDLWEHGSWLFGGFENAGFYVDVGLMKAFVDAGGEKLWCKGVLKDWKEYHDFEVRIDKLFGRTHFFIDGERFCELPVAPGPARAMIRETGEKGALRIEFTRLEAG